MSALVNQSWPILESSWPFIDEAWIDLGDFAEMVMTRTSTTAAVSVFDSDQSRPFKFLQGFFNG